MKTVEVTDDVFELLNENMGGSGAKDVSEVIDGMQKLTEVLIHRNVKLEDVLKEIHRHGYDWHYEDCEFDDEKEETCNCGWRSLAKAVRACEKTKIKPEVKNGI